MTSATYGAAMARVYADEGGYSNDPKDPGGATNFGITIFDARKYWKKDATAADVRAMPQAVAAEIYRAHYANPLRYDEMPAGFDYSTLDAGINSGVGRVVPWSASALGKPAKTIAEVVALANAAPDKVALIQKFWGVRLAFLTSLRTWSHFGKGWGRRVAGGEAAAVKLWLRFGAMLSPAAVDDKMRAESKKAATASKAQAAAATTSGTAGTGTATAAVNPEQLPAIDPVQFGLGGKIALAALAVLLIGLAIFFIHRTIVNKQRADAYATA